MVNWERNWRGNGAVAAVRPLVSSITFGAGVTAMVLVLLAWFAAVSVFLMRRASTVRAPDQIPVPAA
jgi:hypothetical protein